MNNQYANRYYIISGIFVLVVFVYLIRLFFMQIIDTSYKFSAENNSQRYVTLYPARGLIYDRHGKLIVSNQAAYDLMVNPQELRPFDTSTFCSILGITPDYVRLTIRKARNYSRYKSSPFLYQIPDSVYAAFQEQLYKFPGFYVQPRTLRHYERKIAAHFLGYVGEVDSSHIKNDPYYQMGDYIGMSGLEKAYEKELRGVKGVKIYLVDVHNRIKGSLANGRFDKPAIQGKNITSTIDADLQAYGEKLIKNFRGGIVAIEPSTGEILVLTSNPSYDPQMLIGRGRASNFVKLRDDPSNPLFNRALQSKNPPGSTFKLLNALVGLQTGAISPQSTFGCAMGYTAGPVHVGCHLHPTPLDLIGSIQYSCNAYYCNVFRRIIDNPKENDRFSAYQHWRELVMSFGLGKKIQTDLPHELGGNIPSLDYYNRIYRKSWNSITIISLSIGQGEIGITPLQLANMAATIANRGYYYIPHSVKLINGYDSIDNRFKQKQFTAFDSSYFEIIVEGMYRAVNGPGGGTALNGSVKGLDICGKTGTAQNPHGDDHSIFIAFAPRNNPKIAIAVYIENGGFGATIAVPIASLMIEKYLTDTITRPWYEEYLRTKTIIYPKN
ncbi:MAG: penicillin-binding protein 2 [Bacteroidales bacterium]|nr:penicillin-binding protein 2 [Bacteroidales bacterium]